MCDQSGCEGGCGAEMRKPGEQAPLPLSHEPELGEVLSLEALAVPKANPTAARSKSPGRPAPGRPPAPR